MSRNNKRQIFYNIEVIDAGAKGKTVAKAPDGRIVLLPNAVPGDVVDHFRFVGFRRCWLYWLSIWRNSRFREQPWYQQQADAQHNQDDRRVTNIELYAKTFNLIAFCAVLFSRNKQKQANNNQ